MRLGIRFVREDEGFDRNWWRAGDVVQPIVAALDPNGAAAAAGLEVDAALCSNTQGLLSGDPSRHLSPTRPTLLLPLLLPPQVDDMVLSINGHTGLSNTQAAAQLRELTGAISIVVRKSAWVGGAPAGPGGETPRAPETPRSAMRRLV